MFDIVTGIPVTFTIVFYRNNRVSYLKHGELTLNLGIVNLNEFAYSKSIQDQFIGILSKNL